MTFTVSKVSVNIIFCPDALVDAINDDVLITTECEDVTVDDNVNLTIFFEGSGPLSGAENNALNTLVNTFECEGTAGGGIDDSAGIVLQHNRRSFISDIETINYEGAVAAVKDIDVLDLGLPPTDSRGNVLIGTLRAKNPNLYPIPNNYPVYTVGFCVPCNRIVIDIADAAIPAKMPAIGVTQFGQMEAALPIVDVIAGGTEVGAFVVSGDETARHPTGKAFSVSLSTGNDDDYRVFSSSYSVGDDETTIVTESGVVDATVDGRVSDVGFVTITGETRRCNTGGTSPNDAIYVASGGGVTPTKPTGVDEEIQLIARVTHPDPTNGRVLVFGAGRSNDVPNLEEDHIWIGDSNNLPEQILLDDLISGITGTIAQCVTGKIPARAGSTKIPRDNTAPLITEGTEIWSQAFTITDVTNEIVVTTSFTLDTYNSETVILAIFRDSVCIGSTLVELQLMGGDDDDDDDGVVEGTIITPVSLTIKDSGLGASPVTYSARVGRATYYGCWYVNRTKFSSSLLGGTLADSAYAILECNS